MVLPKTLKWDKSGFIDVQASNGVMLLVSDWCGSLFLTHTACMSASDQNFEDKLEPKSIARIIPARV